MNGGVSPDAFMHDSTLYAAYAKEAEDARWTDLHELLALNTEVTHAMYRQLRANAGAKEQDIPEPLEIPRPGVTRQQEEKRVVSPGEASRVLMGGDG